MRSPSVLFYVQHLLGIGHLARASRICEALADNGYDVVMVTGGMPVDGFPPARLRHVALPPIAALDAAFSGLADASGTPVDEAYKTRRCKQLVAVFRDLKPNIVLIEAFPFGRRQMRFELLPLLEEMHGASPRPRIYSSVRDVLQARAKPGRDAESVALLRRWFDGVLVHGDPDFIRIEESFPLAGEIADQIIYTGLVAAGDLTPGPAGNHDVVVSAGGGAVGASLVHAAVEAARRLPQTLRWCVIAGPNMAAHDYERFAEAASANVDICRFRDDFRLVLKTAELSISQAGYNTIGDVLSAGCRAILVPFSAGGETEQQVRADRLVHRGLARAIQESDLTPEKLAGEILHVLAKPKPASHGLDLDGARRTADLLQPEGSTRQNPTGSGL